jgi:hypothetical protein
MAIGVGSIVAVKTSSAQLAQGNATPPSGPAFGCNESASTPFTVTWQSNGSRVTGIPITSLDEIIDPSASGLALLGQIVNLTVGASPALNSVVVDVYARNTSGVGDCVLMKSLQTGALMEALASAVTVQAGL